MRVAVVLRGRQYDQMPAEWQRVQLEVESRRLPVRKGDADLRPAVRLLTVADSNSRTLYTFKYGAALCLLMRCLLACGTT